jgi:hypothetical protein
MTAYPAALIDPRVAGKGRLWGIFAHTPRGQPPAAERRFRSFDRPPTNRAAEHIADVQEIKQIVRNWHAFGGDSDSGDHAARRKIASSKVAFTRFRGFEARIAPLKAPAVVGDLSEPAPRNGKRYLRAGGQWRSLN